MNVRIGAWEQRNRAFFSILIRSCGNHPFLSFFIRFFRADKNSFQNLYAVLLVQGFGRTASDTDKGSVQLGGVFLLFS